MLLGYCGIKLRVIYDTAYIRPTSHFRQHADACGAGQKRELADPFSSDIGSVTLRLGTIFSLGIPNREKLALKILGIHTHAVIYDPKIVRS